MSKPYTEEACPEIVSRGARKCLVIPDPENMSIEKLIFPGSTAIKDEDEAGDDLFVVRIGNGAQEVLSLDGLLSKIGSRSQEGE